MSYLSNKCKNKKQKQKTKNRNRGHRLCFRDKARLKATLITLMKKKMTHVIQQKNKIIRNATSVNVFTKLDLSIRI